MKKIAVLMGGRSSEREVSLASGRNVAKALSDLGTYEVVPVDLVTEDLDALPDGLDAVYIALHGGWGENGGVQAALNARRLPYTGPGVAASRIAMDKVATKRILEAAGVPTAPWALAGRTDAVAPLPLPVVVKPPADGSSVGISKVTAAAGWSVARDAAFACVKDVDAEAKVLVEAYIPGREFTVAVVGGEAWPVIEIVAKGGWYGYDEKYRSDETRYPFLREEPLATQLQALAVKAYAAVGCRGVTRVDFRVSPEGACYVLELNTSPGFTSHSLVPKAGMETGLSFGQVCDRILASADYDR